MKDEIKKNIVLIIDAPVLFHIKLIVTFVFIVLCIFLPIKLSKIKSERINLSIQKKPTSIEDGEKKINDPFLSNLAYSFQVDDVNSKIVTFVLEKNPNIKSFIGDKHFKSLYNLSAYLVSNNMYNEDYDALKTYVSSNDFDASDDSDLTPFLLHLRDMYLNFVQEAISINCFSRARWINNHAYERLKLIDPPPLINSEANRIINKILLYKAFLIEPIDLMKEQKNTIIKISQLINSNFDKPFSITDTIKTKTVNCFVKYVKGIYQFRRDDFTIALTSFEEVANCAKYKYLRELATLMQGRCIFWKMEKEETINKISKERLRSVLNKIDYPNYKNDIIYYLSNLVSTREKNDAFLGERLNSNYSDLSLDELLRMYLIIILEEKK